MYEKNFQEPNNELTLKLTEFFNVSTDYLLGKTDVRNIEQLDDPLNLAKIGFSMKDYNPPSEKQQEQIRDLLEVILKDNKKENDDN